MTKSNEIPAGESTEAQDLNVELERYFAFLRDIGAANQDPVLSRMAEYAYGYGTAKLEDGDWADAAKQLTWLVNEAFRYEDATAIPGAPQGC
ncbi:hypothetical protein [Streptomyces sp. CBMA156]|uniref:hypothetical protein n=1 Tax=Streptomyces sp. CBMA156 TaxID=1930280 RepID=UPI001661E34E|nr:hypothetical protein [Streptomyces sp. CBMA156]MBD0670018.1 hypothetical protein [Streptomyces sp. CBMA156]